MCKNICAPKCKEQTNDKCSSLSPKKHKHRITRTNSLPKINYNNRIDLSEELDKLNKKSLVNEDVLLSDEKSIFFNKKDCMAFINYFYETIGCACR